MDQIKIGNFIAERRKSVNLTQMQLAELLSVTDRAVSKWERGKCMPDSSIMLKLCELLKITVTDLLTGEIVNMENHDLKNEQALLELVKQKEQNEDELVIKKLEKRIKKQASKNEKFEEKQNKKALKEEKKAEVKKHKLESKEKNHIDEEKQNK